MNAAPIAAAFLALAAPFLPAAEKPAEKTARKVSWEKDLWPIIERSCVECHREPYEEGGKMKEPKAELRFDGAWAILKGGENGPVFKPGDPGDSPMYARVTLPEDDADFMPSKGEALSEAEREILKTWIEQGADFGGWEGNLAGKPAEPTAPAERVVKPLPPSVYEVLSKNVPAPDEAAIKAVADSGARVDPLSDAVTLYRVDYFNSREVTGDEELAALDAMKQNIAQLNLGETGVTDGGLAHLGALSNLVRLDLHETSVGDPGIEHLLELPNLEYLNLYGTKVSDKGLRQLAGLKKLKAIYLWNTAVTDGGVKNLAKALPGARINWR